MVAQIFLSNGATIFVEDRVGREAYSRIDCDPCASVDLVDVDGYRWTVSKSHVVAMRRGRDARRHPTRTSASRSSATSPTRAPRPPTRWR